MMKIILRLLFLVSVQPALSQHLSVGVSVNNDVFFMQRSQNNSYYNQVSAFSTPGVEIGYLHWLSAKDNISGLFTFSPIQFGVNHSKLFEFWKRYSSASSICPSIEVSYGRTIDVTKKIKINLEAGIGCRFSIWDTEMSAFAWEINSYDLLVEEDVREYQTRPAVIFFPLSARLVIPIAQYTSFYFKPYLNVGLDKWQAQDIQFFKSTSSGEIIEQGTAHYMNNGSRAGFVFGFLFNLKRKTEQ